MNTVFQPFLPNIYPHQKIELQTAVTGSQKRVRSSVNEEKALNVVMAHPFAMAGVNSGAVVASESGNRSGGAGDYCKSGDEGEGAGEYKSGDEGGGALSAEDAEVQKVGIRCTLLPVVLIVKMLVSC